MIRSPQGLDWLDRLAVGASAACVLHCLALPLLLSLLPVLTTVLTVPESFHVWALVFAIPLAAVALVQGQARHGSWWPLLIGAAGLMLMSVGALGFGGSRAETVLTVTGGLALASAHLINWRRRHG